MDNQKPGHTTVESLKLPLALRRCPCADHRRRSRRPSPSATGACRCATSDPGAPRPIPDAHIRDCRLHWVPSTRPYNTTKQSVHGGHRARGPTISPLRPCQKSNTSVVKATNAGSVWFSPDLKENAVKENS